MRIQEFGAYASTTALGKFEGMEQMRTRDLEARRKIIFDIQRYAVEQQYYVNLYSVGVAASWPPYVKGSAPTPSLDYGNRAAALWLDRSVKTLDPPTNT